jgi:PKHD-type hydroxylase
MNQVAYWKWDAVIPQMVCEALLNELDAVEFKTGVVGYAVNNAATLINEELRSGETSFLPAAHWFEGVLMNYIHCANTNTQWNFDINGNEEVQIASYQANQQYDWHWDEQILQKNTPAHRKLTIVCQLSKTKDFSGGGLFLDGIDNSVLQNQGDVVVFPSFLRHKAAKVTAGKRMTAVCWATGPYFK